MLQRYVEVAADVGVLGDGGQQGVSHAVRLDVHEPQPSHAWHRGDLSYDMRERVGTVQVASVRRDVLADEHDLARAERHKLVGLGDDVGQPRTHVGAADRRDRAVSAAAVAAI